jgi:CheY-like chemotaxis protein
VKHILDQAGYTATTLANPLEALSLVFQLKPDLILCDIAMPELDGYEVAAMLRRSTAFRQTPIVMLTGKDGFIDRVKAKMVGATDYLTKPFGAGELLMIVERYIESGTLLGQAGKPLTGLNSASVSGRSPATLIDLSKDLSESDTTERTSQSSAPFH